MCLPPFDLTDRLETFQQTTVLLLGYFRRLFRIVASHVLRSFEFDGQEFFIHWSNPIPSSLCRQNLYYYFEFPTRHPYKICWFEFWVRRPKRLALVAATAARFRGSGGRGGGDHGGEGRVPRAQRWRRPRRVSYRRTEISRFELSDLNENEVKKFPAGPGEATENHFTFASGGWGYPPDPH